MNFEDWTLANRIPANNMLKGLSDLIDWNALEADLQKLYRHDITDGDGHTPYEGLVMLKAMLLGHWYNLSDSKLEEALRVRIDFFVFCGLSLSDPVPDSTTLSRFRDRLKEFKCYDEFLKAVDAQLDSKGLMIKKGDGAVANLSIGRPPL